LAFGQLVVHGPHDCRIAHRTVVDGNAVDDRDGEEQPAAADLGEKRRVLRADVRSSDVVVVDSRVLAVAPLQLGSDDGRDLLRRPRRASTTRQACRLLWPIEDFDENGCRHVSLLME
jgi:hypothetical protein